MLHFPGVFATRALRARAEALRPRMYRVALAWTHDPAAADDLVQESLARALERIGQLREAARLEAWIFRIMANCWRDALRARHETLDLDEIAELLESGEPGPEQLHASFQLAQRVRAAVGRLPLGQRQVVALVDLGEFSYADAAAILEVPVGTVMSRLCRARELLRRLLATDAPAMLVAIEGGKARAP
ncbi:MAG: RNA polymerase sigma factor [Usitatibacter sp.]